MSKTIFCLAVLLLRTSGSVVAATYDGLWWNKVSHDRRVGFVAGEGDCYYDDLKRPDRRLRTVSYAVDQLNRFYRFANNGGVPVRRALGNLPPNPHTAHKDGSSHLEKHGYYDGLWWKGAEQEGRVGFVEGYLSCLPDSALHYPRSAESYEVAIGQWYASPRNSEKAKIADVLARSKQ